MWKWRKKWHEKKIGSTNKRIDKVDEGLEGYHACVDTKMQQQVEEWGLLKDHGGGLAEEVKELKARVPEQDRV